MIRRMLGAVVALLLYTTTAFSALDIPVEMWQPNKSPGYCGWASLKTLMLYHGWDDIAKRVMDDETKMGATVTSYRYDMFGTMTPVVKPPGGCTTEKIEQRMAMYHARYGLQYKQLLPVSRNTGQKPGAGHIAYLRRCIRDGWGAVVSVQGGAHAVVLVDISEKTYSFTYQGVTISTKRMEHEVVWIDCNDVRDYKDKLAEYRAGTRKKPPAKPTVVRTSFEWWVQNDWDGWAVVIKPNEAVLAKRREAAKNAVVKLEEKPDEKRTEKRGEPTPPTVQRTSQPQQELPTNTRQTTLIQQEPAPTPPATKLEELEEPKKPEKPKPAQKKEADQMAKVPLTDIAPIIAPLPPAANVQTPLPTFPKAQPQPLLIPAIVPVK